MKTTTMPLTIPVSLIEELLSPDFIWSDFHYYKLNNNTTRVTATIKMHSRISQTYRMKISHELDSSLTIKK